jgi:alanine racemase
MSEVILNLNKLANNIEKLRNINPLNTMGVCIKSNSYGHDSRQVITAIQDKIDYFFVATSEEAFEMASDFSFEASSKQIMTLYTFTQEDLEILDMFHNIIFNICDMHTLRIAADYSKTVNEKLQYFVNKKKLKLNIQSKKVKFNLNIDTGMGDFGLTNNELAEAITILKEHKEYMSIFVVNTHFATADDPESTYYDIQVNLFKKALDKLITENISFEGLSYHNTASLIRNEYDLAEYNKINIVRTGIGVYGYYPSKAIEEEYSSLGLEKVLSWQTIITSIKHLRKGDYIGYGNTFICKKATTIATIPVGYYEGYNRKNSNLSEVQIKDMRYPVVGRVRMNSVAIDITNNSNEIKIGDKVELINENITADNIAVNSDTINYEVLTNIK